MHVTSPGCHGGCKGEGHDNDLSEREVGIPNWLLNRDVVDKAVPCHPCHHGIRESIHFSEQSSLPYSLQLRREWNSTTFIKRSLIGWREKKRRDEIPHTPSAGKPKSDAITHLKLLDEV